MDATIVSHIAICVRDLEKSLAFYQDILGMHVTFDQVQDTSKGGFPDIYTEMVFFLSVIIISRLYSSSTENSLKYFGIT